MWIFNFSYLCAFPPLGEEDKFDFKIVYEDEKDSIIWCFGFLSGCVEFLFVRPGYPVDDGESGWGRGDRIRTG